MALSRSPLSRPSRAKQRVPRITQRTLASPNVPSFRHELAKARPIPAFKDFIRPRIAHQILFVFGVGNLLYVYAGWATTNDTEEMAHRLKGMTSLWSTREATSGEMRRAKYFMLAQSLKSSVADLKTALEGVPKSVSQYILYGYSRFAQTWLDASEIRHLCWKICAVNTGIWAVWQIPSFQHTMMRAFTHSPISGLSLTLVTSIFSHKSFIHLLFNNMALCSFGPAASHYLIGEQEKHPDSVPESTSNYHFLAVYLIGGMTANLASHVVFARFQHGRIVKKLMAPPQSTPSTLIPTKPSTFSRAMTFLTGRTPTAPPPPTYAVPYSLGASGAIYSCLAMTALGFPDVEVSLAIPPTFPIPIQWAFGGMVSLDILGILRGWRRIDHVAHLGGAAVGALYWKFGPATWNKMQKGATERRKHT